MKPAPIPVRRPPSPPSSSAADGVAAGGRPATPDDTLEGCVLRNLERYFSNLDGAPPHALHEMVLRAVERPLLVFALERCAGNQSAAAELLGINRNTLRKKLLDYRIS